MLRSMTQMQPPVKISNVKEKKKKDDYMTGRNGG